MNMEQPDPAGLFNQFQGQRQTTPANRSVMAQISQRPAPPASIPRVSPKPAPQPAAEQSQSKQPVNPFVALYESGAMEKSIEQAQPKENPFKQLYDSGLMTQSVLESEDIQYEKDLEAWKNQNIEPVTGARASNFFPSPTAGTLPEPVAPARDIKQIEQDWKRGVHHLRGQELTGLLGQIEAGEMSPEQEAVVTRYIEPMLPPDFRRQLNISRMTRDKYLEIKSQYDQQMAEQVRMRDTLGFEGRRQLTTPREMEQMRGALRGVTFNYAFSPDKDRLSSSNPEEVADERARRLFYQKERAEYPVSSLAGEMSGALLPIGLTGNLLRTARTAQATRAFKAGPPTAQTAGLIARGGAPATTGGVLAEGAAIGLPYDLASRPEGSEDMSVQENLQARLKQAGFGVAVGVAGDLVLTKGIPSLLSKGQKVAVDRKLNKLARDNDYKNIDEMMEDVFLKEVDNERIRMSEKIYDILPDLQTTARAEARADVTATETPTTTEPTGRTERDIPESINLGEARELPPVSTEAPLQAERPAPGEVEATVPERAESPVEEAPTERRVVGREIVEAPVDELTLSADVPQFKEGANLQGVVEPLGGTFDRTGVGPVQVWVRNDGSKEVISGRHRLDLAKRSGEETIPAQYHYESEGFGRDQAAALDAMLNIREGQGKVKDYVDFIKATGHTQEEADAQGILARATGRRAYTIATDGTDALIAAHRGNQLSDEAATRIASAAPNNEALQAVGIKAIQDGKSITVAENMVKAVRTMTDETAVNTGDMFGFDDSALKEAEQLARKAAAKQAEIQKTLSAVQGAAKNPELAAREGVDVKDPEAVKRRIAELKQQKQDWQNWHTNPELTAELRGEEVTPPTKTEPEAPAREQEAFDLTTQTEAELSARETAAREAEATRQQEQTDLEARARADEEAKDFELGIQGSGQDVSARQADLLGAGGTSQKTEVERVKAEELTKPFDDLNTNEYYSFLESLTDAEQQQLKKQLNIRGEPDLEKLVDALESSPRKERMDLLRPIYEERLNAQASLKSEAPGEAEPETVQAEAPETRYSSVTNTPDPKAKDLKGGPYTLDYHNNIRKALAAGELSVDDFKAAFNALMDNKDEVMGRLKKYKKNNLMGMFRGYADTKADAVEKAFNFLRNRFVLDNDLPDLEFDPFNFGKGAKTLEEARLQQEQQVSDIVRNMTQEDLDRYGRNLSEQVEKRKAEVSEQKARIANPQTLEDYQLAIRENGKESLTTAQRSEYERLNAEAEWQAREAREQKKVQAEGLETEEALEIEPITEGTHTKTGETIYNVKVQTKLGKQKFQEAAKMARSMGGNYYKGNFWLKTHEDAEQFVSWLNGQTIDRSASKMQKETAEATTRANKLRSMADKLEEQGSVDLNVERRANTPRQMDQAASARAKATKKVNFARTLRNIANGIEDGTVRFLSKLSNMTQLETLNSLKRQAVPENLVDSSYNGYSTSRNLKEGVTLEDYIDRIRIPEVQIDRDEAVKLAENLKGKRGFARLRKELEKEISIAKRSEQYVINMNPHSDYAGLLDTYVRKHDAHVGWLYKDRMEKVKRLQRMGITSDDQLRSAIRELEAVKSQEGVKTSTERKLDDMRFKIKQSARSFNDFFPTPDDVTSRVVELADIEPGMKTLEPNAGMGHIAEKLQAAAGKENVDLVEMSSQLVDYLETAGHKVTHSDFLKYGDADNLQNSYDRIVMNPPFSKDQDIDHVMHAYDLLKPGGKMTAIMSSMAGLRSNQKNRTFSDWLDEVGAHVEDLEAGAFKSSFNPTSVNTKVVVIDKPHGENVFQSANGIPAPEGYQWIEKNDQWQLRPKDKYDPLKTIFYKDPERAVKAVKDMQDQAKRDRQESTPPGTTLYSSPVIPAASQVADLLHLNPAGSFGGAVYGGIAAGDESEAERFSQQWWLDSAFGAAAGAVVGAAGFSALKKVPLKGRAITGEQGWGKQAYDFLDKQITRLPGLNRGDKEVLAMGKQQRLLKALIERQAEKAGEYLLKNFTPEERSIMADLIEQRGIIAEGNLLHRQAQELDDFISYTSKKLQELGMLDETIEPGAYLHRYYSKHLGITGLAKSLTPKGKGITGTWSIRRGTQEVFDSRYMSESMRDTMQQVQDLKSEYDALKQQSGDLVGADTQARMDEIKNLMKELQGTEFREYLAPENGTLKSFFLAADEVPLIPGLKTGGKTGLPEPVRQGSLEGMTEPPTVGSTGELVLTDRRWTIDGMKEDGNGILHRDWTKAERESWGEINDAAYRMVRGQAEVAHDLSLGIYFRDINERFSGSKVSDTEIEGWHKVPDTKVGKGSRLKKYGALSGKYVTEDIWQAVRNHGRNPMLNFFNNNPAVAMYLKGLGKWKAYKTVYNPVSHVNNSVSNLQMYYLSDYDAKYLAQAFKELRQGEASDLVREANNSGLFGNDWTSEITGKVGQKNIDELLEKLRTQPEIPDFEQSLDTMMGLKQWYIESANAVKGAQGPWRTGAEMAKAIGNPLINTASKPINKAANAMQKAYRMEDEFFKMAVYLAERQKGTNPFEAVEAANRYFFDYNDMPDAVKWARDFPIGSPFVSYTYFAVPAIVRTAVEKPEKILALAAALEGINYASMAINGELQDQGYWDRMADESELYPSWMQGRSIWGGLNNVSIPFLESYKLGLANANVVGNPLAGQVERSDAWPSFMSFWGAGWYGSNPITTLINDITNNEDWRGSPIWSEGAPASEQVRKGINYVYQNLAPSNPLFPASYHQQKNIEGMANQVRAAEEAGEEPNRVVGGIVDLANAVSESLGGTQFTGLDRRENEILARDALAGSVGFKLRPVRVDQFEESKNWELDQEYIALQKWINEQGALYEDNRLTEAQIEEARAFAEAEFMRLDQRSTAIGEAAARQR